MDVDETRVKEGAFRRLPSLKMLKLTGNSIRILPEKLFWPLENLTTLIIQEKEVLDLKEEQFVRQAQLKNLEVQVSNIKSFQKLLFAYLPNLETLELREMKFFSDSEANHPIPEGILDTLVNLKNFTVTGNGFEFAPVNIFAKTKLENFAWSLYRCFGGGRDCMVQVKNFFKGIASFKSFKFHSAFKVGVTLASDIFEGCEKLESFFVYRTKMDGLPKDIFKTNRKMKVISVVNNMLPTPEDGTFDGLVKLEQLHMSRNRIEVVSNAMLRGLIALKKLDLSTNAIKSIGSDPFASMIKLEELDLSNNVIDFNDSSQPRWSVLTSLKILDLSNNSVSLSSIPHEWSGTLLKLRDLNLSQNNIGPVLDVADMKFVQNSITVNLGDNNISRLDFTRAQSLQVHVGLSLARDASLEVPVVRLAGNPLSCDCRSLNLARFMRGNLTEKFIRTWFKLQSGDLLCKSPSSLAMQLLTNLAYDDFYCPFPVNSSIRDEMCPEFCECRFTPYEAMTNVDCEDSGYTTFPLHLPMIEHTRRVSLNMNRNGIKSIKDLKKKVRNFSAISELYLDGNDIEIVRHEDLPPHIVRLSLADNAIKSIDEDTLGFFGANLNFLQLGQNIFECGCESTELFNFVHKYDHLIGDVANVTISCGDGRVLKVIDTELAEICTDLKEVVIYYVLPVILIIVFVLVLVILYLHHKRTLYIWSYSKPWLRDICFPIPPPDDMVYDLFVSYSSEDREFVEDNLIQQLEHGAELKYKCLMAIRDFNPGENIIKQISEAVKTSRRTAVVLSKNFVQSTWYEQEFTAAYQENRVIVIVLGEVPTREEMGSLMWDYIKTNTYLPANDPWFWDKLRYALPHKGRRNYLNKKRRTHDKIQLIEAPLSTAPSPTNLTGSLPPPLNDGAGQVNAAFSPPASVYITHETAPNSASSNGHVMMAAVDT
jgi:protein toll